MSETATETPAFDVTAYLKDRNGAEHAKATGKDLPAKAAPAEEPKPKPEDQAHVPTRAQWRAQNRLREELGAERARREDAEARLAAITAPAAVPKPAETDEPKRKDYANDADFAAATAGWKAAQKVLDKKAAGDSEAANQKAFEDAVLASDKKFAADRGAFDEKEWADLAEDMSEDKRLNFRTDEPIGKLIISSDVRAAVLYWAAKNPDKFEALAGTKDIASLIQKFRRVEGIAERLLDERKEKSDNSKHEAKVTPAETKKATAADRDAKLAKPSVEVDPKGGSGVSGDLKPYMEDGKTLNPAYKAQQMARYGVRA